MREVQERHSWRSRDGMSRRAARWYGFDPVVGSTVLSIASAVMVRLVARWRLGYPVNVLGSDSHCTHYGSGGAGVNGGCVCGGSGVKHRQCNHPLVLRRKK